jgi:UDP-N-acetylmuramoylalanine--D-glutamate ligase
MAAAQLLRQVGASVHVSELRQTESTTAMAQALRRDGIERIELGDHSQDILEGCSGLVVSPGVPDTAGPVQWAREIGLPIISEIELAFRFCPSRIVAVTGTNGKSSVVTLIARLQAARRQPAVACGNIGIPFSGVVAGLTSETTVVAEVSSFQLMSCHTFRPEIGVLLNLGANHLDRHPDRRSYAAAKARLFQCQTAEDVAVLNGADPLVAELAERVPSRRVWFGGRSDENPPGLRLLPATRRLLPENLQAVLQVGRILGVPDPLAHQVIREFRGLEHRVEHLGTIRGVRVVNDAKSTTPESCRYALSLCPGAVVPILGGRDKGLDFGLLREPLAEARVRGVVLIGESRPMIRRLLRAETDVRECGTLEEALRAALACAHPGDTVLFSPACASFDMFRNFEERGRLFKALVARLQAEAASGHGRNGHANGNGHA